MAGWLARLLGTDPDSRVRRARRLLERGRPNDARLELEGVEHPEAEAVRAAALAALVELNLEEARVRANAGDPAGAEEHLELARTFGATPEQLRAVRREAREAQDRARAEARRRLKERERPQVEGDDPLWSLPPDDPRVRFALWAEGWPEELRGRLLALGPEFARAVLLLEDGRAAEAVDALGRFVEREPAVRVVRAQAAAAAGRLPLAASDLRTFGDALGHRVVGGVHATVLLAQVLARLGRLDEAIEVVEAEIAREDSVALQAMRASLLEAAGRFEEAERAAARALRDAPREMGLYRMVARLRVRLGRRVEAMQVLESGLAHVCTPGRCGSQPFDVEAGRMLARLYLEDRLEPKRAEELLVELSRHVLRPEWEDRYLVALVARNRGDPEVGALARRLVDELPAGDPRRERVRAAFAEHMDGTA